MIHRERLCLRGANTARVCLSMLLMALLSVLSLGCGSGGGSPATPVSISVGVKSAALAANAMQTFTATVTHAQNTAVTWSVQEGAAGGSITGGGVYTAPATPGTYHVVAASQQDATKTAVITIVVSPAPILVGVAVQPPAATVTLNAVINFSATVTGSTNPAVIWSVQEAGGGTITVTGVYTAPGQPGVYHVIATSVGDSSARGIATITVQAGGASGTIQ